jgi:ADP-ribose pyrophosphatase YjhB (NUDIX family)
MNLPDCYYRTSVKALVLNADKKFLLIKEANGKWELPGGGLEFGEKPHDCLHREVKEEMGLEITSIAVRPSYFISLPHETFRWITNILYEAQFKDLNFTPSSECVELRFFTISEARNENLCDNVSVFLQHFNPSNH